MSEAEEKHEAVGSAEWAAKRCIKMQGGKSYLPVAPRVQWFRTVHPDWGISTSLIEGGHEAGFATVQAIIYNPEGRLLASGMKTESKHDFPAGWVEKAESGAVGRALALLGFGTQFTPELDESPRIVDTPRRPVSDHGGLSVATKVTDSIWEGDGPCPFCHAKPGTGHVEACRYIGKSPEEVDKDIAARRWIAELAKRGYTDKESRARVLRDVLTWKAGGKVNPRVPPPVLSTYTAADFRLAVDNLDAYEAARNKNAQALDAGADFTD